MPGIRSFQFTYFSLYDYRRVFRRKCAIDIFIEAFYCEPAHTILVTSPMDTMAQQSKDNTESAPKPPSALSLINIILVLLVTAVGGLAITSLLSQYFADQEMVHASYPFSQSKIMMMSYPPMQKHLGSKLVATDTGKSTVHWNFPNAGSAEISLQITGADGTGYARLGWNRIAGKWHLLSARWVDSTGIKHDIPMGHNGRFLNATELEAYRKADPVTPIGRGNRA